MAEPKKWYPELYAVSSRSKRDILQAEYNHASIRFKELQDNGRDASSEASHCLNTIQAYGDILTGEMTEEKSFMMDVYIDEITRREKMAAHHLKQNAFDHFTMPDKVSMAEHIASVPGAFNKIGFF